VTRECFEIRHPKEAFILHVCMNDGAIKEGRLFVNLWTEWDGNLSDGIIPPDENPCFNIPRWMTNDDALMERLG